MARRLPLDTEEDRLQAQYLEPLQLTAPAAAQSIPTPRQPGNIDLSGRPVIQNEDGSISTIETISIGTDQGEVVIPTIINGQRVTPDQAVEHYRRTGQHLGIFDTPDNATAYARQLSQQQGQRNSSTLPGFTPLPFYRSPEGDQAIVAPIQPTQENLPLNQAMSDIMAGRPVSRAQQDLIDSFVEQLAVPNRKVAGKVGTEGAGLDWYVEVPGQVEFINGSVWIHDETNQERPWTHFTRNHAFDPRTGQLYETRSAEEEAQAPPLAGAAAEIGPRAAHVARGIVVDPVVSFGRWAERTWHGLVVPRQVEQQEAATIAGGIMSGSLAAPLTREAARVLREGTAVPSRVASGQPMYHGTPTTERITALRASEDGALGRGVYLIESRSTAREHAEISPGVFGQIVEAHPKPGLRIFEIDMDNLDSSLQRVTAIHPPGFADTRSMADAFRRAGYDGIRDKTTGTLVVFDENNVTVAPPRGAPTLSTGGADDVPGPGMLSRALASIANAFRRPEPAAQPEAVTAAPAAEPRPSQRRITPTDIRPRGHIAPRDVPAALARRAEAREARIRAESPELDDAGFFINALEQTRRRLPEEGTARDMHRALKDLDVSDGEMALLGLDRMLLGEVGAAQGALRQSQQNVSRLNTLHDKARRNLQTDPNSMSYREEVARTGQRVQDAIQQVRQAQTAVRNAGEESIRAARQNFRNAEAHLKTIERQILEARGRRQAAPNPDRPSLPQLYEDRIAARRQLVEDRAALSAAREHDIGSRTVPRSHIETWIRANRPRLDFEVREFPKDPYGPMTIPIGRIRDVADNGDPNMLNVALVRRGIDLQTAETISRSIARIPPTQWGQQASALGQGRQNPRVIWDAIEEAAGASIANMAAAWRGSTQAGPNPRRTPRYRSAIPDEGNTTMQEIAIVLKGPWDERKRIQQQINGITELRDEAYNWYTNAQPGSSQEAHHLASYERFANRIRELDREYNAAPRPPFTSGHWYQGVAPIGHMQVTMQRAPIPMTAREAMQVRRLAKSIEALEAERGRIGARLDAIGRADNITPAMEMEEQRLITQDQQVERSLHNSRRQMPRGQPSSDQIYMGNQFQSDWSGEGQAGFRAPDWEQRVAQIDADISKITQQINGVIHQMTEMRRRASFDMRNFSPQDRARFDVLEQHSIALNDDVSRLGRQKYEITDAPTHHGLVANTRAWLRPVLEQFIEQGIRSGARYIGVPSGATVNAKNTIGPGTMSFYDEALRRELMYVMKRKGIPYDQTEIRTMFSPDGTESFQGHWFLLEIPANMRRRPSKGVRLMEVPGTVPPVEPQREEVE